MRHAVGRAVLGLCGALLLVACGGSSGNGVEELDADAILAQAQEAVAAATSVRVVGTITEGASAVELDLTVTNEGNASGTLTNEGQTVTFLSVDGASWYSADEAFWVGRVGAERAATLDGKYVALPEGDTSFDTFADWDTLWEGALEPDGQPEKGEVTELDGQPVIELVDDQDEGILYVALEGEPYPLGITSGSGGGSVQFRDWNADTSLAAPPEADVVDLSELG